MNIVFCSSIFNMQDYNQLAEKSKLQLGLADHNLNLNIIKGLDAHNESKVILVNNVQIPNYPNYPKINFKRQKWSHVEGADDINCGFINLPILKHLSRAITTCKEIRSTIKKVGLEDTVMLTYDIHVGICLGIRLAKIRFPKLKTCLIMPDVPANVILASSAGKISLVHRVRAKTKMAFINMFDEYVFITKYMDSLLNKKKKPFVVIEGIYDNESEKLENKETGKKVLFYGGQLNPVYGIKNLVDAFNEICKQHDDYELWVCGGGPFASAIREEIKTNPHIKYFGYVNGERIKELHSQSTVLVNPRQNKGDYVNYSFPSKTMDYLASGKPMIGYKLNGIPDEYDQYIQYVDGDDITSLKEKIVEICSKTSEERDRLGCEARSFIFSKKNPSAQTEQLFIMLKENVRKEDKQ